MSSCQENRKTGIFMSVPTQWCYFLEIKAQQVIFVMTELQITRMFADLLYAIMSLVKFAAMFAQHMKMASEASHCGLGVSYHITSKVNKYKHLNCKFHQKPQKMLAQKPISKAELLLLIIFQSILWWL